MTPRAPVRLAIACALAFLAPPAWAARQHPPSATQQAVPARAEKPGAEKPGAEKPAAADTAVQAMKSGAAAAAAADKPAPSLEEVARRISAVLSEQSGRPASGGPGPASRPGAAQRGATAAEPALATPLPRRPAPVPRAASLVTLTWDTALTQGGVALSWDRQLDPRRTRAAAGGVRLVWPDRD
jgi:hypothetical protein